MIGINEGIDNRKLQGLNVVGTIVPLSLESEYATHDSKYGKGGWREVETIAERDAITGGRRRLGMVVFVKENYTNYQLKGSLNNDGWVPLGSEDEDGSLTIGIAEAKKQIQALNERVTEVQEGLALKANEAEVTNELNNIKDLMQTFETKEDAERFATKELLKQYATSYEVEENFATKVELAKKADKDSLNAYALKTDLDEYATRVYMDNYFVKKDKFEDDMRGVVKNPVFQRDIENDNQINMVAENGVKATINSPRFNVSGGKCFATKDLTAFFREQQVYPITVDTELFGTHNDPSNGDINWFTVENGPYFVIMCDDVDNNSASNGGHVICLKNVINTYDEDDKQAIKDYIENVVRTLDVERFIDVQELAHAVAEMNLAQYVTKEAFEAYKETAVSKDYLEEQMIAENVDYTYAGDYHNVKEALDKLLYVAPAIKSFIGGGVYEKGTIIDTATLSWELNKPVTAQALNQGIGEINKEARNHVLQDMDLSNNATYTLTVTDEKGNKASASTSILFKQKRYWGVSKQETLDNDEILALSNEFCDNAKMTKTFNCSGGGYFYFALPAQMCSDNMAFYVGSLPVSAFVKTLVTVKNELGYLAQYYVYRSLNYQTGNSITLEVK